MSNEKKKTGLSAPILATAVNKYLPLVEKELEGNSIQMSSYARQCVMSAMVQINRLIADNGLTWGELDSSNLTDMLLTIAGWELNPSAMPREVYFTLRKKKVKKVDSSTGQAVESWQKWLDIGIEGDGNDAILARFGRNVRTVHPYWAVREGDGFEYPAFNGLEITPPKWQPKGKGKIVRVVYPVTYTDGHTEYHIGEREDVLNNLMAHISNNMMNATFGIAPDRYKASPEQKKQIDAVKKELLKKARELGFGVLDAEEFEPFVSPAWRSDYSREAMILRKMRNNVAKKIPKDFAIPRAALAFAESEGGGRPEEVIEADFAEIGVTQSAEEQAELSRLNAEVSAEVSAEKGDAENAADQG